jgi:tryptophanyl-tRNA synthetase
MKYLIGIQPTGRLHVGNYLGCIKQGIELQEDMSNEVAFMIAQIHARTSLSEEEIDQHYRLLEKELQKLGVARENIYGQPYESLELMFDLACKTGLGTLTKMPNFTGAESTGILMYPLLMIADIIHFQPDCVIIGEDQVPHLDLFHDLAPRVGYTGRVETRVSEKIMSLRSPTKKMSKSEELGCLYMFDPDLKKKVMKAVTDEAGLKNLYKIAQGFGITETFERSVDLKETLIETLRQYGT